MTETNNLMCYHCSKTWCANCFTRSIRRDRRCPNCRKALNKRNLIRNYMLSEIIQAQAHQAEAQLEDSTDICDDHKEKLTMRCMT